jgi:hypothetical protein
MTDVQITARSAGAAFTCAEDLVGQIAVGFSHRLGLPAFAVGGVVKCPS